MRYPYPHGCTWLSARGSLRGPAAVLLLLLPLSVPASPASRDMLIEQLRADHAVMVSAEQEYRAQRRRGLLSEREALDYAGYVARLHRRVAEDCRLVMEAGIELPGEVVCPSVAPAPRPAGIDLSAERSRGERTGALDAELLAGLGEFDEMLLREQERIKAAAPRTDASGGGGGGQGDGDGGGGQGTGDGGGGNNAGGAAGSGSQTGSAEGAARGGGGGAAGGSRGGGPGSWNQSGRSAGQPEDIPDGSDDDVVARQLREAAEKETDPELKEKLWEEYRKYKQGTR